MSHLKTPDYGKENTIKQHLLPPAPEVIRTNSTGSYHTNEPGCFYSRSNSVKLLLCSSTSGKTFVVLCTCLHPHTAASGGLQVALTHSQINLMVSYSCVICHCFFLILFSFCQTSDPKLLERQYWGCAGAKLSFIKNLHLDCVDRAKLQWLFIRWINRGQKLVYFGLRIWEICLFTQCSAWRCWCECPWSSEWETEKKSRHIKKTKTDLSARKLASLQIWALALELR